MQIIQNDELQIISLDIDQNAEFLKVTGKIKKVLIDDLLFEMRKAICHKTRHTKKETRKESGGKKRNIVPSCSC